MFLEVVVRVGGLVCLGRVVMLGGRSGVVCCFGDLLPGLLFVGWEGYTEAWSEVRLGCYLWLRYWIVSVGFCIVVRGEPFCSASIVGPRCLEKVPLFR